MITPSDTPSNPGLYDSVAVSGTDIQAPQEDLSGLVEAAGRESGAGIIYPQSDRQAETEALLKSPPGYEEFDITGGYSAGGGESWPADPTPGG
jgi:hypothetical protein